MIEKLLVRLIGDGSSYQKMTQAASKQTVALAGTVKLAGDQVNTSIANLDKFASKVGTSISSAGKKLTAFATVPIVGLGVAAFKSAADLEKLEASMKILAGGAEIGAKQFQKIKTLSASTPFQMGDLASTNNLLLGAGMSADEAFNSLKRLGDMSAATGSDLDRVAVAYSQSFAVGRIMSSDLNQFANNGIPIYKLLGDVTGKNAGQIREMASSGKLTFDILEKALEKATDKSGIFEDGMLKLSETLSGKISTLKDNVILMIASFGDLGKSDLGGLLDKVTALTKRITNLSVENKKLIVKVVAVTAAMGPLLMVLGPVLVKLSGITSMVLKLGPALLWLGGIVIGFVGVWPLAIAAIAGGVAALAYLSGSWQDAGQIIENTVDAIADYVVTGLRIVSRIIRVFSGWLLGQWDAIWEFGLVNAIIEGIKMAGAKLAEFGKWAAEKMRSFFTGSETGTLDDFVQELQKDVKAGREAKSFKDLMGEFGNIVTEENARLGERREGKQIVSDKQRETIQQNVTTTKNAATDKFAEISSGIKELVEIQKEALVKKGLEVSGLDLSGVGI